MDKQDNEVYTLCNGDVTELLDSLMEKYPEVLEEEEYSI